MKYGGPYDSKIPWAGKENWAQDEDAATALEPASWSLLSSDFICKYGRWFSVSSDSPCTDPSKVGHVSFQSLPWRILWHHNLLNLLCRLLSAQLSKSLFFMLLRRSSQPVSSSNLNAHPYSGFSSFHVQSTSAFSPTSWDHLTDKLLAPKWPHGQCPRGTVSLGMLTTNPIL